MIVSATLKKKSIYKYLIECLLHTTGLLDICQQLTIYNCLISVNKIYRLIKNNSDISLYISQSILIS